MNTKEIINYISKNKFTKWVQAIEVSCFLIGGYLLNHSLVEAIIITVIGLFAALIASESAIEEYKIKIGDQGGTR